MTRIIKRYVNRRLYDTEQKKQITLQDLAELVKDDVEIQVIDNKTGEDITADMLVQVVRRESKGWKDAVGSTKVLADMVKKGGGTMADVLRKGLLASIGVFSLTKERAEELVDELVKRGEVSKEEKAKVVKELVDKAEARSKELAKKIDVQVKNTMAKMKTTKDEEIQSLKEKIDHLTAQVETLQKKMKTK
ncbi:MAG: phasin family protein [Gemmatimonadota bacterium]|nr:MAG: phasin family protein [Gemmatimonadota bacterium]